MLLGPLCHSIPPPPLRKNGHIKGRNLKWAYDVLTFMPNYGLKTKRWRWDLSQPLLSLPCFFIQFKRLGREEGKERGKKRRSISTQRGRGNWFCFASSCSDSWMNCFECAKREVCVCVRGGVQRKTLGFMYSLTKWAWTGALIRLVWTETWQQTLKSTAN